MNQAHEPEVERDTEVALKGAGGEAIDDDDRRAIPLGLEADGLLLERRQVCFVRPFGRVVEEGDPRPLGTQVAGADGQQRYRVHSLEQRHFGLQGIADRQLIDQWAVGVQVQPKNAELHLVFERPFRPHARISS